MATQPLQLNDDSVSNGTQGLSAVTNETHPVRVAYPNGAVVAFPASLSGTDLTDAVNRSWEFLKNEGKGLGQTFTTLPSAVLDSATEAPTSQEQRDLGISENPSLAQKLALGVYRNLQEPVANAAEWYATAVKHNQNIIDQIPEDVLAQGLGAGAGAAILGKVLAEGSEGAPTGRAKVLPVAKAKGVAAPTVEVEGAQNLSENSIGNRRASSQRSAIRPLSSEELDDETAAFLRTHIRPGERRITVQPVESAEQAPATNEDVNAFLKSHFGNQAHSRVQIESAEPGELTAATKPASSSEVKAAALKTIREMEQRGRSGKVNRTLLPKKPESADITNEWADVVRRELSK